MEIKTKLNKPYKEEERLNFIVENNHKLGYEIRETENELQAWGYTNEELLKQAKQAKYNEANNGAKAFLESGNALFEFEPDKHIEATDGNIAKLTAYALAYVTGQLQPTETVVWNTKEDETVELTQAQIANILLGLGVVQSDVWTIKFAYYLGRITVAETIEEVNAINIDYTQDVPETEETEDEL